jgi:Ca-activated chloride channel family protein
MSLSSPWLLVLGLLVVAALASAVVIAGRRRTAVLAAAGIADVDRRRRRQGGRWCTVAGLVVLALAAAGPRAMLPVGREAGTVIVTIDVSTSMTATDVAPSRFAAAQQAAIAFIQAQPDTVDVGVVGFNQGAITTTLPNADHTAAITAIRSLQVAGGTSLGAAIVASLTAITGKTVTLGGTGAGAANGPGGSGSPGASTGSGAPPTDETGSGLDNPAQDNLPNIGFWPSATIVMFSDGEDTSSASAAQVAATLAENAGVHIDTVGIGTASGATVTADGYQVHTALNADELTAIARTTGGSYHPAGDAAQLNGVASSIDLRLTVSDEEVALAGAFVGVALLLLGVGVVLTVLRTGRLV